MVDALSLASLTELKLRSVELEYLFDLILGGWYGVL